MSIARVHNTSRETNAILIVKIIPVSTHVPTAGVITLAKSDLIQIWMGFRYGQRDASGTDDASHCHVPNATTYGGWHKRASGMPVLPSHVFMLLLPQTPLPGQTRAIGHAIRLRVLQPYVSYEELADDTQELAASRYQRRAQAALEGHGHEERLR